MLINSLPHWFIPRGWLYGFNGRGFAALPLVVDNFTIAHCAVPENIHTPPMEGFFILHPPPSPYEIPVKLHTSLLKFWLLRTPSPWEISNIWPSMRWVWIFSGTTDNHCMFGPWECLLSDPPPIWMSLLWSLGTCKYLLLVCTDFVVHCDGAWWVIATHSIALVTVSLSW